MSLGSVLNQAGAGSYTRDQILSDTTKTAYGLTEAATPDDVFNNILLRFLAAGKNAGIITVTVKTPAGTPLSGVQIDNVTDINGTSVVTNEAGIATGFIEAGNTSYGISKYGDIEDVSAQQQVEVSGVYSGNLVATPRNFLKITSNGDYKFSVNVTRVDVSVGAAGGGSGGSYGRNQTNSATGASGAGGHAVIQEDVSFVYNTLYPAKIGAGGTSGLSNINEDRITGGTKGGNSSFLGVEAEGGEGGGPATLPYSGGIAVAGVGGAGNPNGTQGMTGTYDDGPAGSPGTEYIYTSFTETGLYGGSGGIGTIKMGFNTGTNPGGVGGQPGGGNGGSATSGASSGNATAGEAGADGLGGGAGVSGFWFSPVGSQQNPRAGKGGSGVVAIRMHLKATT